MARSTDDASAELPPVPTGIQRLIRLASLDAEFLQELIEHRGAVAAAAGVPLTKSEEAILAAIDDRVLSEMVAKMPPPSPPRRAFLRQTAATAVVLLGGAALAEATSGCDDKKPKRPHRKENYATAGATPKLEPDAGEQPPPRPESREMEKEGGCGTRAHGEE